ncbi:MAG: hypothetical protein ATN34_05100 [Epulopiscium sp. Nele67-Bin002]|nr:MAG: hypothetical protein BEN18_00200 [Epulopiscium sp. Nuni2H_MBin001]OON91121.1 MAG: hypothetical protein ATN34_05100 [Epulopiscium sp. Nele67-Bin002]
MNDDLRSRVLISAIYLVLGILSFYSYLFILFIPVLIIPFVKYHTHNSLNVQHVLLDAITILLMAMLNPNTSDAIIYATIVILPTYILVKCYRNKEVKLPQILMYLTVTIWIGLVIQMGAIDQYIYEYYYLIDEATIQMQIAMSGFSASEMEYLNELLALQNYILKLIYPTFIFVVASLLSFITILLTYKINDKKTSLKQLLEYRLNRFTLFLIALGWIWFSYSADYSLSILGINMLVIMFFLYSITGFFGLISLVIMNGRSLFMTFIAVLFFASFMPWFFLIYGLIDTIFNVRKVKVVI